MEITTQDEYELDRFVKNEAMVKAVRRVLEGVFLELRDDAVKIADKTTGGVGSNREIGELLRAYGIARKRLNNAFNVIETYRKVEEPKTKVNPGL